ncbi:MAG TPA: MucR family transcriptional regulator [Allosphingosinicella sp.]|nr:MucR family transcriptional regulator [Allosphingosinicella sp.]
MADSETLVTLTADIVSAHVANNRVAVNDMAQLIESVHGALAQLGATPEPVEEKRQPVVSARASVKPDYLICLIDGSRHKMLRRHLAREHDMSPAEYRAEFGLRDDYPMTAPNYTETRRQLAKKIGLGRKGRGARGSGGEAPAGESGGSTAAAGGKRRGRPPKK